MKYGIRLALGVVVGTALAGGLAWFMQPWWLGAVAGGLFGPLVFLGTFFLWSADRPEEGYEQVLFDRPNTVLSVLMTLAFVGLAFGTTFLATGLSPEEQAALARMDGSGATLARLSEDFAAANDAFTKGESPGDLGPKLQEARDAKAAIDGIQASEALAPLKGSLLKAATALESAFDALGKCAAGDTTACLDARLGPVDAARGLQAYDEARAGF